MTYNGCMGSRALQILEEASNLSSSEREMVSAELQSVDLATSDEIQAAWEEELVERIQKAERGETTTHEWSDVVRSLRAKYERNPTE
jgi:hypothetical protein